MITELPWTIRARGCLIALGWVMGGRGAAGCQAAGAVCSS
jgi:hypothetical protein